MYKLVIKVTEGRQQIFGFWTNCEEVGSIHVNNLHP